jgi:hypothetical protein
MNLNQIQMALSLAIFIDVRKDPESIAHAESSGSTDSSVTSANGRSSRAHKGCLVESLIETERLVKTHSMISLADCQTILES